MSVTTFVNYQKELFSLFKLGLYDEVHLLIDKIEVEFPERIDKTIFWRACVYSLQGNEQKAMEVLNSGLQNGIWWNPLTLTYDNDLKSLQNLEEFKVILAKCQDILQNQKQTIPELFTYGNEQSNTGIFSLHWRGSNVTDFSPYWLNNTLLQQYLFAFPQSSQVFGYNTFCWDNQKTAVEEISIMYKNFKQKYKTKLDIITGASQGAKLAIELSLNGNILGTKGFIAVIPAIQNIDGFKKMIVGNGNKIKGVIITGDKDPFYDKTVELAKILEENDFPCKFIVIEGLGHYFPDNFPDLLKDAVEFILSN